MPACPLWTVVPTSAQFSGFPAVFRSAHVCASQWPAQGVRTGPCPDRSQSLRCDPHVRRSARAPRLWPHAALRAPRLPPRPRLSTSYTSLPGLCFLALPHIGWPVSSPGPRCWEGRGQDQGVRHTLEGPQLLCAERRASAQGLRGQLAVLRSLSPPRTASARAVGTQEKAGAPRLCLTLACPSHSDLPATAPFGVLPSYSACDSRFCVPFASRPGDRVGTELSSRRGLGGT